MGQNLIQLRKQIDRINTEIFILLLKRIKIAKSIAKYKKNHDLKITDKNRERKIIITIKKMAKRNKLNPELVKEIFKNITKLTKKEMQK